MTEIDQQQLLRLNAKLGKARRALVNARTQTRAALQLVAQTQDELDQLIRSSATTKEAQHDHHHREAAEARV